MPLPLPARQGDPGNTRHRECDTSAESTEHQHSGGIFYGFTWDQTGHRERQVHRWEHEEPQQGQRGELFAVLGITLNLSGYAEKNNSTQCRLFIWSCCCTDTPSSILPYKPLPEHCHSMKRLVSDFFTRTYICQFCFLPMKTDSYFCVEFSCSVIILLTLFNLFTRKFHLTILHFIFLRDTADKTSELNLMGNMIFQCFSKLCINLQLLIESKHTEKCVFDA